MSKRAFTLIELLIVVAIIAILAAIAVPNFLEAQTRSKVTRTKADMMTIARTIEAYRVDNNYGPADIDWGVMEYVRWSNYQNQESGIGKRLTSPIAYITSIPFDVFNTQMNKNMAPHNGAFQVVNASVFMRAAAKNYVEGQSGWCAFPPEDHAPLKTFQYMLSSCGPDLIPWPANNTSDYWSGLYYDPSNGTVSVGDICYINTIGIRGGGGQ